MEYIDDLSWSNIVKLIQQEDIKGADLLNTCAIELEEVRKTIAELESEINRLKRDLRTVCLAFPTGGKYPKDINPEDVQMAEIIVIKTKLSIRMTNERLINEINAYKNEVNPDSTKTMANVFAQSETKPKGKYPQLKLDL